MLMLTLYPNKPGKLAQRIPIYGTILGQRTRILTNAGPTFLVCRDMFICIEILKSSR